MDIKMDTILPLLFGVLIGNGIMLPLWLRASAWWFLLSVPASIIIGGILGFFVMDRFVWERELYRKHKE